MIETMMKFMIRAGEKDWEEKKKEKSNHLRIKMVSGNEGKGLMASSGEY